MLAIQHPFSPSSPHEQSNRTMRDSLPPLPHLQHFEQRLGREQYDPSRSGGTSTIFASQQGDFTTTRHGLRTPPADPNDMNGNPLLAPSFGPLHYKGVPVAARNTSSQQHHLSSLGNTRYTNKAPPLLSSYQPTHKSQNSLDGSETGEKRSQTQQQQNDGTEIVHYLQIPRSINDSKGSLAEFAAQITCLFWFESSITLQLVEESKAAFTPLEPLLQEAMPTIRFRKLVTTVLSTTQVTQNVILLALMFIYRLKRLNPGVKGKLGSEFRLLIVALMLGNKCKSALSGMT